MKDEKTIPKQCRNCYTNTDHKVIYGDLEEVPISKKYPLSSIAAGRVKKVRRILNFKCTKCGTLHY